MEYVHLDTFFLEARSVARARSSAISELFIKESNIWRSHTIYNSLTHYVRAVWPDAA